MKKGFTLIATIFIVLVVTLLAITTSTFISSEARLAVKNYYSLDAFYIANAGMEYYVKQLDVDTDWSTPPTQETKAFSGGVFIISTTDEAEKQITVTVTGLLTAEGTTYRRVIKFKLRRTAAGFVDYPIYFGGDPSGDGIADIKENVTINGNIFVNSDLDLGTNVIISGDAYASGNITGDTSGIAGTYESEASTPETQPTLDTSYYADQIHTAQGYSPGDRQYRDTTLSGTYYVNGNVTLEGTITITGSATIVATSRVVVGSNSNIGNNLTVIAAGQIGLGNNVNIGGSGLWFSSTRILVEEGVKTTGSTTGEGTVLLTPGDITFGKACEFYGLVFAEGTIYIGSDIGSETGFEGNMTGGFLDWIGRNSTITHNPELVDYTAIKGLEGAVEERIEIADWDEVY